MSTPLPITHDCCWQRPAACDCPLASDLLATIPRAAARLWRAFARWQVRKLERRIAAFEPDRRWLQ
jgi:hypothetical protein